MKKNILSSILLGAGILTFYYMFLSLKNNYPWTVFAGGFGALYILLPISVVSGGSCLIHAIIGLFVKKRKIMSILSIIHIGLAIAWIISLQGLSLTMKNEWIGKPKGALLDRTANLGELLPDTKWVESDQRVFFILPGRPPSEGTLFKATGFRSSAA